MIFSRNILSIKKKYAHGLKIKPFYYYRSYIYACYIYLSSLRQYTRRVLNNANLTIYVTLHDLNPFATNIINVLSKWTLITNSSLKNEAHLGLLIHLVAIEWVCSLLPVFNLGYEFTPECKKNNGYYGHSFIHGVHLFDGLHVCSRLTFQWRVIIKILGANVFHFNQLCPCSISGWKNQWPRKEDNIYVAFSLLGWGLA